MYKLTVIAGPNRGTSYAVQEGELSIGRQTGNTVVLTSSKVSKRHCVLIVTHEEVVIKDQGSSNGTFVNGILTKTRKVLPGDRISVGEFVFELVEPQKRASATPVVAGFGNVLQLPGMGGGMGVTSAPLGQTAGGVGLPGMGMPSGLTHQPPKDLKGKIIWQVENQFMPLVYGLNLKHEWRSLCMGILGLFVIGNLVISVYPLMESSRTTIVREAGIRAKFMAREIAEKNAPFLAARMETKADLGIIETAEGVRLALLIDLDNRIIAPATKMNQYLASGAEAKYAVNMRDRFRSGDEVGRWTEIEENTIVAVEPVKVLSPTAGKNVIVAMALVSIDTSLSTPDLGEMGMVYSETLILTGILGGILFYILYRLTLKPFQVLNEDMDKALKGDLTQVTHEFKCEEMNPLWEIINSAIQRIPKTSGFGGGLGAQVDNAAIAEEFVGPLRMFGNLVKFGLVAFDGDKKIIYLNSNFEEISGIRSEGAIGREMSEVARDQSMGPFTQDILARAPVGGEGVSEDFDFSGISYKVHVAAFGTPGNSAKCYIFGVVKSDA